MSLFKFGVATEANNNIEEKELIYVLNDKGELVLMEDTEDEEHRA